MVRGEPPLTNGSKAERTPVGSRGGRGGRREAGKKEYGEEANESKKKIEKPASQAVYRGIFISVSLSAKPPVLQAKNRLSIA